MSRRKGWAPQTSLLWKAAMTAGPVLLVAWLSPCGVVWDAPEIDVVAQTERITFGSAEDENELTGGETILKLTNDSQQRRRLVLARVDAVGELPHDLYEADFPYEDERILDMTSEMRARRQAIITGGIGFDVASGRFHVYLRPGATYVLFDTIDESGATAPLWFRVPGNNE